jgi:hypothetical protein
LEDFIEDIFYLWELDSLEPTPEYPGEAILKSLTDVYQKQMDGARETGVLRLMERAEHRVKKQIERRKDMWNAKLARAKLREALDDMDNVEQNLEYGEDGDEFLLSDFQKRRMEQAREQVEKAAEALKQVK